MVVSTGALLNEHISFASSQPTPARIADTISTNASHSVALTQKFPIYE